MLALLLSGCSTLESLNPFASNAPKMAELQPFTASKQIRVVWQENVGKSDGYALTPAVIGSTVYAAGRNGTLVRIDDGKEVWRIKVGHQISGGVGADLTTVVVGSDKGEVLAYSSADGKLLWTAKATSEILSPPALGKGFVVVRSGDNRLAAYDLLDGKRKWLYQRPIPSLALRVTAPVLIDGDYVFAGFPGGKLIAISASNGAAVWEGTVALPKGVTELDRVADITSVPAVSGRMLCAVAFQGRVACFDLGNGNLAWAREMSSSAGLGVDNHNLYVSNDKGAVHAFELMSGTSVWKQEKLLRRQVTAPLLRHGFVAVADVQGVVHFLSREDGSFVARQTTDGSAVVAPLQALGSGLLVQTSKGGLFAIEAE